MADDNDPFSIPDSDLRVETITNANPGATIRVTHIPTGISRSCSENASRHRNRDEAMRQVEQAVRELEARGIDWVGKFTSDEPFAFPERPEYPAPGARIAELEKALAIVKKRAETAERERDEAREGQRLANRNCDGYLEQRTALTKERDELRAAVLKYAIFSFVDPLVDFVQYACRYCGTSSRGLDIAHAPDCLARPQETKR